ncbi:MAG: FAD-dependent oxidoreductase [bacterium]|nr:FAD-dependent oxidoreductase [bacterium]
MTLPATGRARILVLCLAWLASAYSFTAHAAPVVNETARELPLVYEADVAVVGGGTGAVAAAVAAAESGATVFLATPRPYLGADMCAPLRLWLESGETPESSFEEQLLIEPNRTRGVPLAYVADLPSMDKHVDTDPPAMLTDGRWGTAFTQSVQYNGDVSITADLGEAKDLEEVRVMFFQSDDTFEVDTITVSTGDDGATWTEQAHVRNAQIGRGNWIDKALAIRAPVEVRARYVQFHITKGARAERMLLGEIQVHARDIEGDAAPHNPVVLPPLHIKRVLEDALRKAGVEFLYGCYATSVLTDESGTPAGVEIVNRAGRQAVKAKVIIDATDRAWLARSAGARFRPYPAGPQTFRRIVGGGSPLTGPDMGHTIIPLESPLGGRQAAAFGSGGGFTQTVRAVNEAMLTEFSELLRYKLAIPMPDASYASFAEAEQIARDRTYHAKGLMYSETIWQVPPDPMHGVASSDNRWPGAASIDLDVFRPGGIDRIYVLGACANISREAAVDLVRPIALMRTGIRIGKAAAKEAATTTHAGAVRLAGSTGPAIAAGDTREPLRGLRPMETHRTHVRAEARSLPVFGEYDVVVAGGGTSGAPAAIGAARSGARTLVLEYLTDLGGVGTTGLIGVYCAGYREGFTVEAETGIAELGSPSYVEGKKEWWRREIRKAGGDIWFGALACGAFVDKGVVKGVVVATPQGRGVVLAKTVVDGTGNGDVAIAAGAESMYIGAETVAMQGTGLPQSDPGASYINTDWTYVDETDLIDVRSVYAAAKRRYEGEWDLGQLIDTRERRRVLGDYVLTPLDIINRRTFPDTVGISQGGRLDSHGFTIHPYYLINNYYGGIAYTPYRCLLPKGLDGILVTGLAVSAHRDATPSIRMQPCMQNLGYAAGCAAASAARMNGKTRSVDVRKLQEHLVAIKCLTPEVPAHQDSFPLPDQAVRDAVQHLVGTDYTGLAVIMASWDRAAALLREAYASASTPEGKLRCAHVLGVMGDPAGFDTLAEVVASTEKYDAENIDVYFPGVTWLDSYIIALGRTRDRRATPIVLDKLRLLGTDKDSDKFSHYRAVCEALEQLGDSTATEPLGQLLKRCGEAERAATDEAKATGVTRGRNGVRNLIMARVLYRCGDWENVGRNVLEVYAKDLRGVYARHARAVLKLDPGESTRPEGWLGL